MGLKRRLEPEVLAWHFLSSDRTLGYGDGRTVTEGKTYSCDGPLELCKSGMHASINPLDALGYAPGLIICRVAMSGDMIHGDDKLVARHCRVLWIADATAVIRHFARLCALDVIHLWDCPDVTRRYLETGDESLRAAADAARDAAWAAARDAARAARDAAWAAARDAAWAAAWAARDAARAAAWDAAWAAAWAAARDAAWAAQSQRLTEMLEGLRP